MLNEKYRAIMKHKILPERTYISVGYEDTSFDPKAITDIAFKIIFPENPDYQPSKLVDFTASEELRILRPDGGPAVIVVAHGMASYSVYRGTVLCGADDRMTEMKEGYWENKSFLLYVLMPDSLNWLTEVIILKISSRIQEFITLNWTRRDFVYALDLFISLLKSSTRYSGNPRNASRWSKSILSSLNGNRSVIGFWTSLR